jgi:hypothetical protein
VIADFAVGGAEANKNGFSKSTPKTDVFNVVMNYSLSSI